VSKLGSQILIFNIVENFSINQLQDKFIELSQGQWCENSFPSGGLSHYHSDDLSNQIDWIHCSGYRSCPRQDRGYRLFLSELKTRNQLLVSVNLHYIIGVEKLLTLENNRKVVCRHWDGFQ
jgi:hypothetical protein